MIDNTKMDNRTKYFEILQEQINVFEPLLNPLYENQRRELTSEEENLIRANLLIISNKLNLVKERDVSLKELNKEKENLELLLEEFDSTKFFNNLVNLNFKMRSLWKN